MQVSVPPALDSQRMFGESSLERSRYRSSAGVWFETDLCDGLTNEWLVVRTKAGMGGTGGGGERTAGLGGGERQREGR